MEHPRERAKRRSRRRRAIAKAKEENRLEREHRLVTGKIEVGAAEQRARVLRAAKYEVVPSRRTF